MNFFRIITAVVFLLGSGTLLHAQIPQPISLIASPSSPSSGQKFTVQAATPTTDSDTATFRWTVNGIAQPDASGIGKHTIALTAGSLGSETRVAVSIAHARGIQSASLVVRVSDLALTWFAETYVPPWYRGKALPSQNAVVNFVAMPRIIIDGAAVPPERLIYQWSLDGEGNALRGLGERIFRIRTLDLPGATHTVRVTVEDSNRRVHKEALAIIVPTSPRIALYAATPLGGVEPRAARSFLSLGLGILTDFQAEPFFFPVSSRRDLSYRWTVGGRAIAGQPENPSLLTLNTGAKAGTIPISILIDDREQFIPSAAGLLNLILR